MPDHFLHLDKSERKAILDTLAIDTIKNTTKKVCLEVIAGARFFEIYNEKTH